METFSLSGMLRNHIYFFLKLRGSNPNFDREYIEKTLGFNFVNIIEVPKLNVSLGKEKYEENDIEEIHGELFYIEDWSRTKGVPTAIIAPDTNTIRVLYCGMRDWCPSSAYSLNLERLEKGEIDFIPLIQ